MAVGAERAVAGEVLEDGDDARGLDAAHRRDHLGGDRAGRPPAERLPITASPSPTVTSASGARTTSKPRPRISAALARAARSVVAASPAAPAAMNDGKSVLGAPTRSTMPPSWSTPRKAGQPRAATTRSTLRLTRLIWPVEATLLLNAITPPRCSRRTSGAGEAVPA